MKIRLPFAKFLNPFFYVYCLAFVSTCTLFSLDRIEEFYDDFLTEEEEVLAAAGLSSQCSCNCKRCGTIPYPTSYPTPDPIFNSSQVWSFVSEPDLHPMKISVNTFKPGTSNGLIFLAPYGFSSVATYGQSGALILDNDGNPIWFRPLSSPNLMNTDFRVQTLNCKPVLTF